MSRVRYSYCVCCSPSWLWLLLPLWFKFLILSTLLYAFPISSIRQKSASFWKMEDTCREGTTLVLQDKALTRYYLDRKLLDGALCLEANPVVLMLLSVLWKLVPIYRLKKCCHQCSTSSFPFSTLAWHPQLGICRVCVCWRWGCWKSLSLCCLNMFCRHHVFQSWVSCTWGSWLSGSRNLEGRILLTWSSAQSLSGWQATDIWVVLGFRDTRHTESSHGFWSGFSDRYKM